MNEMIEFECGHCQSRLKVPATIAGKQAKCPTCNQVLVVPMAPQAAAVPPPSIPGVAPQTPAAPTAVPPSNTVDQISLPGTIPTQLPERAAAPSTLGTQPQATAPAVAAAPGMPSLLPKDVAGKDTEIRKLYKRITDEVAKVFVGQDELVLGTLVALFCGGHVLIESVPGLGKTLFVRTLGRILGCQFGRIQFTADLMPSDITGAPIFNMKTQEFDFRAGPVFTQLLLADEINRSPAKTHAALLEIMQEKNVTVDGVTHELAPPFLVMATQNPIESEGTYNLPEAQLDRFMFKLVADYPTAEDEAKILNMHSLQEDLDHRLENDIEQITSPEEIVRITKESSDIRVAPKLVDYINNIVRLTRSWPQFYMGASPRAGIGLMQGVRTLAAFYGREYAVPDDVVQIALPILRHRVMLTAEAEVEGQTVDQLLRDLIRSVEVPRLNEGA